VAASNGVAAKRAKHWRPAAIVLDIEVCRMGWQAVFATPARTTTGLAAASTLAASQSTIPIRPPPPPLPTPQGTVAPISYVADVMFPHARDNARAHLEATFSSAETQADIEAIRQQVRLVVSAC
jgi:hypothetical protein